MEPDIAIQQFSPVERLQHRCGMGFGDAEEGAGGAFGMAVALFPVLEGAGAYADEGGELALAEAEFVAHGFGIGRLSAIPGQVGLREATPGQARRLQGSAACGVLLAAQDGTALLEAGGKLLEEFVFHGNSFSMMDLRTLI